MKTARTQDRPHLPGSTAIELGATEMVQPQRGGMFIANEPRNRPSSVGAASNQTCRPDGAFGVLKPFTINMPLLRSCGRGTSAGQNGANSRTMFIVALALSLFLLAPALFAAQTQTIATL